MPLCPYCSQVVSLESTKKENRDEIQKEIEGLVKKEVMYTCPHCDKILGFAFFFGGIATRRP